MWKIFSQGHILNTTGDTLNQHLLSHKRAAAWGPFCFRCFLPTRVGGAAGSYFFSFLLLASPFRSPVPPCLLGNPPDCPWPLAPPPQSVCSVPIFNNYNSVTNLWTQPQNTEPLRKNTVKHERSDGKSLKWKKNGLCTCCFCRPKDEGHIPNAFWANVIPTVTYVRRKNPPRAGRSLCSNANDFHVPYAHVPRFEPTWLWSSIGVWISAQLN
jgi:hypothetical protein